jgi:hypothetical protein
MDLMSNGPFSGDSKRSILLPPAAKNAFALR